MAIAQVIKYEGDNTTFVWKHPSEDFNSMTQLIVHESQEALFFMNGEALDLFGPGRHTLESQNIPKIGKFLNRTAGDQTPFHCEVYFINKTNQMNIKWGTDSKVEYMEPTYHFPIAIGVSGEMSLRVSDSRKLLVKLVGTETDLTRSRLAVYFRSFLMTKVKTYIARYMRNNAVSVFEVDEHLMEFSEALHEQLRPDFDNYGVSLETFFVMNVAKPEEDRQYKKYKELHFRQFADVAEAKLKQQTDLIYAQTEAQKEIIASQARATSRKQEGYTYQQERSFDVASEIAQNQAIGQFSNLGIGLGTMAGIGGTVGGIINNALSESVPQAGAMGMKNTSQTCTKCGAPLPENAKFCLECGTKVEVQTDNTVICPNCGASVIKGKFCPECGFRFARVCPTCGKDVPEGAKFCLECGTKLEGF